MTSMLFCLQLFLLPHSGGAIPDEQAKGENPTSKDAVVVPFEMLASKHMAVQIMVNGEGPFRVIFDTGAPFTLLSNKVSKKANIKFDKSKVRSGPLTLGGSYSVEELKMGDALVKNIPVMVMDHPTVVAIAQFVGPVEGLLGFPFFARFRTTIDYKSKTMTLVPVDFEPGNVLQDMTRMLMAPKNKKDVKTLSASTLWGLDVAKDKDDETEGVNVVAVWPESPAAQAGLQKGDRLLLLDGSWTESTEDTWRAASQVSPGRAIELRIRRGEKEMLLKLRPMRGL